MNNRSKLSRAIAMWLAWAAGVALIGASRSSGASRTAPVPGPDFTAHGDRFQFLADSLGRPDSLGRRDPARRDSTFRDSTRRDTSWQDSTRRDSTHRPPQPKPARPKRPQGFVTPLG